MRRFSKDLCVRNGENTRASFQVPRRDDESTAPAPATSASASGHAAMLEAAARERSGKAAAFKNEGLAI